MLCKKEKMATRLAQFSVDSLDISIDDIESDGKNTILLQQQQSTATAAKDGSDSGLDTASLSNTSYELLRGISSNSTDNEINVPTADLLGLSPPEKYFEKMNISSTPNCNKHTHKSTTKAQAELKNSKNLQRAASLSRATKPTHTTSAAATATTTATNDNNSKTLMRNLQRAPSLSRTRQLSMPRSTIDTGRRLSGLVTLPRSCRQKSVDDLSSQNSRSSSVARETSSRMYNSMLGGQVPLTRKNPMNTSYGGSYSGNNASVVSGGKRKPTVRTTIYHEMGTQTTLTQSYLETLLAGKATSTPPELSCEQHTQTYIGDQQLQLERKQRQYIEEQLLSLGNMALSLRAKMSSSAVDDAQQVLDVNSALVQLKSLINLSDFELKKQQQECSQMRLYCRTLQQSLEQCIDAQKSLMQENNEQTELQEFMEHENTALKVQLRGMEADSQAQLEERNAEIRILRGECCHLVRLNEQRRQENSLMQTRYKALETRQKNILSMHNMVVMQALNAVAELYTRLDNLLQHLITAYNIGEIEQWDELVNGQQSNMEKQSLLTSPSCKSSLGVLNIISTQNQHYLSVPLSTAATTITNKEDLSPECNRSFIAAIIEAIRNATTPARKRSNSSAKDVSNHFQQQQQAANDNAVCNLTGFNNALEDESDSTEMLDSETEPCLMMDNVLEDVTLPDSHSHNMVSSAHMDLQQHDESLHNLSQAIVNRQQAELQALRNVSIDGSDGTSLQESFGDASILAEEPPLKAVVERVVELDSLVTKLLKALHLVQTENNNVIQQLILDKNELQQDKEELLEQLRISDEQKQHFKQEYENAVCQLREKERDLSKAKADVQRQRNDIDVRHSA